MRPLRPARRSACDGDPRWGSAASIRDATGCGLKDAKDLVESESPTITSLTEEKANALKHAIEQAGGTASMGID